MALANKKAWVWVAASGAVVLVLAGLVFLLVRALGQSNAAATALDSAKVRLESYYERNPFPNRTNVVVEKSNAATIKQWRDDLLGTISANQVETPGKTPAQFEIFLAAKCKDLREAAMRSGVKLPASFAFGFARYAEGRALPDSRDDLPTRLAEQVVLVDHICRLMFEERISDLISVTRDEFAVEKVDTSGVGMGAVSGPRPSGGPGSRSRGGAPPAASAPAVQEKAQAPSVYRKLHFSFELHAREQALVGVLNRLAADPMFIVVNSVEFDVPADTQLAVQPRREDVTNTVGRVARPVCGPDISDPALVKIELDVYRFQGR